MVKNPPANAGDLRDSGSIPMFEKIPWRRACTPLRYSGLENPMDRGAWLAIVHVAKNRMQLKLLSMHTCTLSTLQGWVHSQPALEKGGLIPTPARTLARHFSTSCLSPLICKMSGWPGDSPGPAPGGHKNERLSEPAAWEAYLQSTHPVATFRLSRAHPGM